MKTECLASQVSLVRFVTSVLDYNKLFYLTSVAIYVQRPRN